MLNWFKRLTALTLTLALVLAFTPALALIDDSAADMDDSVTRSQFTLSLSADPAGFPDDGAAHYADWQTFLGRLSLRGTVDTQRFLTNQSRVFFDGGLYVEEREALPFTYDGYHSYRYVRSPALRGDSIHFQMHNFFEFMLKGYYFMGLPTQLIAPFLYPESSYYLGVNYYLPIQEVLGGEGDRTVESAELYELCETLDLIVTDDMDYERAYFYFTSLLVDLGASDLTLEKLGLWEDWLSFVDPDEVGMTITDDGTAQTYTLGETTVFTHEKTDDAERFRLYLPDSEGYALTVDYENTGRELHAALTVTLEDEERLCLRVDADGLPAEDDLMANGTLTLALSGEALSEQPAPVAFMYRMSRDAAQLPCGLTLAIDWLHPQTQKAALTLLYKAKLSSLPASAMVEREYDNQNDFFHLNESFMEEYKELYVPSLAMAAVPVLTAMPAGVISDVFAFMNDTGLLAFFGIE